MHLCTSAMGLHALGAARYRRRHGAGAGMYAPPPPSPRVKLRPRSPSDRSPARRHVAPRRPVTPTSPHRRAAHKPHTPALSGTPLGRPIPPPHTHTSLGADQRWRYRQSDGSRRRGAHAGQRAGALGRAGVQMYAGRGGGGH